MPTNYRTETEKVDAQVLNSNWVRKIEQGQTKQAQEEGSAFIRSELRQESFHREIMVPILLADDELDRDLNTDQPRKIVEKEPDSFATFVPFYGTGPRTIFKGPRYEVRFGKIESQRFRKSKFELMTYQNDIRKILSDNSVKDMAKQEDTNFINTVDAILTAAPAQVVPAAAWNSQAFASGFQNLALRKRPLGKMLMTDVCFYEALNLPATAVGNDVATAHYREGIEKQKTLWGIPVVTTIHNDIVTGHGGSHSVYLFAPENYLGNLFLLQDATLYIEQKADIIHFHSYEVLGTGIGNTGSITRIDIA
jgi:hypothetical protein